MMIERCARRPGTTRRPGTSLTEMLVSMLIISS